jgi:hypothetical protein
MNTMSDADRLKPDSGVESLADCGAGAPANATMASENEHPHDWQTVDFPGALRIDELPVDALPVDALTVDALPDERSGAWPGETDWMAQWQQSMVENQQLRDRLSQLEESLALSQMAARAEILHAADTAMPQGPLGVDPQLVQRQQILVETLQEQLHSSQERIAQLERDCALTQQGFNDQVQLRLQAETTCRDLRTRLHRQQQQALQFKTALEKCLEMPATANTPMEAGQAVAAAITYADRIAEVAPPLAIADGTIPLFVPKTMPVQPWSQQADTNPTETSKGNIELPKLSKLMGTELRVVQAASTPSAPPADAPATATLATEAPTTEALETETLATEAPTTEAPTTEALVTEAPVAELELAATSGFETLSADTASAESPESLSLEASHCSPETPSPETPFEPVDPSEPAVSNSASMTLDPEAADLAALMNQIFPDPVHNAAIEQILRQDADATMAELATNGIFTISPFLASSAPTSQGSDEHTSEADILAGDPRDNQNAADPAPLSEQEISTEKSAPEADRSPASKAAEANTADDPFWNSLARLINPAADRTVTAKVQAIAAEGFSESLSEGFSFDLKQPFEAPPMPGSPPTESSVEPAVTPEPSFVDPTLYVSASPSPILYPLRPAKKLKSLAAVELPTFPR